MDTESFKFRKSNPFSTSQSIGSLPSRKQSILQNFLQQITHRVDEATGAANLTLLPNEGRDGDEEFEMLMLDGCVS